VFAWIDPVGGWLVIDAASPARAEEVLDALRDTLDELPVKMVKTQLSPVSVMTAWLAANEATGNFTIDLDCELRAVTDEKAAVRYVRHALDGKDMQDHLAAGKLPTRLAMTFDDRVSFILTEKMEIKRSPSST
jgi:recombination associated protein RdgC